MSVNPRVSLSALMSTQTIDNANQVIATITHDESIDTPLSITNDNGTFYYHREHQGSIIALTDSSGQVVERFTYDNHYGTITDHTKTTQTNNPYAYTGRELDTDELYYYRARYYDATVQRFLGEDPIGFSSQDFNWYRYTWNSPVNFIDYTGHAGFAFTTVKKIKDSHRKITPHMDNFSFDVCIERARRVCPDDAVTICYEERQD